MGKRTAQRFVKDLLKYALGMSNCGAFVSFEVCFFPFGFDGGVWDLIVLVRDNCHSLNFFVSVRREWYSHAEPVTRQWTSLQHILTDL